MEYLFAKYSLPAVLLYLVVRDLLPSLARAIERWLPIKAKQRLQADQRKVEADKALAERDQDLKEREVIAQEKIGDNLTIMNERVSRVEVGQQTIMTALVSANQSLKIVLDRIKREPTNSRKPRTK